MKRTLLNNLAAIAIILAGGLASCQKDAVVDEAPVPTDALSFSQDGQIIPGQYIVVLKTEPLKNRPWQVPTTTYVPR